MENIKKRPAPAIASSNPRLAGFELSMGINLYSRSLFFYTKSSHN